MTCTRERRAAVLLVTALALAACRQRRPVPVAATFRPLPPLGMRLLVLAPHPDDEILGAAGLIEATVRRGGDVHVVVATDGEAGPAKVGRRDDLAERRREETRQALGQIPLGRNRVAFLGYSDGSLATAWTERWTAILRGHGPLPAASVLQDLRRALRENGPDSVVLPLPLDEHGDHRALGRFALLALLAEFGDGAGRMPEVLGYLIHGHRHWAASPPDPTALEPPPNGCSGEIYAWSCLLLDPADVYRKAALVRTFHSQVGSSRRLLRYAGRNEPFALGQVVSAPRSPSPARPGVRRTADGIVIRIPRGRCAADPDAGDRVRLRFFRGGRLEERIVATRGAHVHIQGGQPGAALASTDDLRAVTTGASVRLHLAPDAFADVRGTVLEIIPGDRRRAGPVWLVLWP